MERATKDYNDDVLFFNFFLFTVHLGTLNFMRARNKRKIECLPFVCIFDRLDLQINLFVDFSFLFFFFLPNFNWLAQGNMSSRKWYHPVMVIHAVWTKVLRKVFCVNFSSRKKKNRRRKLLRECILMYWQIFMETENAKAFRDFFFF